MLTSCTSPATVKLSVCEEFCFHPDTDGMSAEYQEVYQHIVSAECLKIPNYQPSDSDLFEKMSPDCDGEDSYCDCTLDSGQSIWDIK
ncbi:MAG: hypothetical protein ACI8Y7_000750 [Candidatus Woesearchaeota archaeon]